MAKVALDCVVIGGGIVGCSALYYLSQYGLSVALFESGNDVAGGATRANSGIVHAGYDCAPGSKKARYNVLGNAIYRELKRALHIPLVECGSLVVSEACGRSALEELLLKAQKNGVEAKILDRTEILKIEPNVADTVEYALYAPSAAVTSPYKTAIALADAAVLNGANILLNSRVKNISNVVSGGFEIVVNDKVFFAKYLVNAAGAGAPEINRLCGAEELDATYRKGEYLLLDNSEGGNVSTVIFPLPTEKGKGVLVAPTADGNVIYGPTSTDCESGDISSTRKGMEDIKREVVRTYKNPNFRKVIKVYAGVRTLVGDDFVIGFSDIVPNLFVTGGICSPGLTSAPAIGKDIAESIADRLGAIKKDRCDIVLPKKRKKFKEMSKEEREAAIASDASWGRIVCRCELVSEAEIVEAIKSPLPATTIDAVKRRVRTGMGRCGGGFCLKSVMKILSRELGVPFESVKKDNEGSEIIVGAIKESGGL